MQAAAFTWAEGQVFPFSLGQCLLALRLCSLHLTRVTSRADMS